jgi:membrane-bound lytic murein transglycosylase D
VDRAIRRNLQQGKRADFWSLRLPKETRNYVPKLLAISALVDDPKAYKIRLNPIPNKPYFQRVDIGGQLDLALAAELAGMTAEELYTLNPAFNRWATAPDGPHHLLIPVEKAARFKQALLDFPATKRTRWVRYQLKDGETLGHVAVKYHTTASAIKRVNKTDDHLVRVGQNLIVPVGASPAGTYAQAGQGKKSTHRTLLLQRKVMHTVAKGETYWAIAQQYKVSVDSLMHWNRVTDKNLLVPGQQLELWIDDVDNVQTQPIVQTTFTAPPKKSTTRRISYRVRRGDSLSHISEKFRVTVSQLREWNRLETSDLLHPGQHLTLYVDVTRFSERI